MDFGAAVRKGRKLLNLPQQELARLAGTSRQAISLLEKNKGRMATLGAVEPHIVLHVTALNGSGSLQERMKQTRLKRGKRQSDIAALAGVAVNTVRALEAGGGSVEMMSRVIAALEPRAKIVVGKMARHRARTFLSVGTRRADTRSGSDYYVTPAPITRLLLDNEHFHAEHTILEPAVGEARSIERVLKERGYRVVSYDIHGQGAENRCFFDVNETYHSVVTNPPFNKHMAFIRHAKKVATSKIAMLLPVTYLTGAARHRTIWSDKDFPLARVHVLTRGVNFIADDPHADKFETAQMYCAWYVFERGHVGEPVVRWIDNDPHVARRRRAHGPLAAAA